MVPPPGEAGRVVVESDRRVAGEVLLRKGHIERDCLSSVSMFGGINRNPSWFLLAVSCNVVGFRMSRNNGDCSRTGTIRSSLSLD